MKSMSFSVRRICSWIFAAVIAGAPLPETAAASESGDLQLQNPMDSLFVSIEVDLSISDPHPMSCSRCHAGEAPDETDGTLRHGDDTSRLCLECHRGSNLHPVGIPVTGLADPDSLAIPLGKGSQEGLITCLTCHYLHGSTFQQHILRAPGKGEKGRIGSLCASCHRGGLAEKSPHSSTAEACHLCHMNTPRESRDIESVNPNVASVCNFCHNALENGHYLEVNPFSDEYILQETFSAPVPLINGKFTCVSCHNPHATEGRRKLLRDSYLELAAISKKINPHWKDVMCIACHEREPEKGLPALKEDGDLIRLCYRCHAFKYSRNDIHPVNVTPSRYVSVPPEMPLKEGRLTCETCHDSSLQEGGDSALETKVHNPRFLRGGFSTRNEFCFRCHSRATIRDLNAHNQMHEDGSLRKVICAFCHSSLPEREKPTWGKQIEFDEEEVNDLCLLCHPPEYRENHPMVSHLVSPSGSVTKAMEKSEELLGVILPLYDGTIVCVTCHNPHQKGVVIDTAAGKGAGGEKRLRMGEVARICTVCHPSR